MFIDPGSSWQNEFIESFNARFRREQHARKIMNTTADAEYLAEEWKGYLHRERPSGSLAAGMNAEAVLGYLDARHQLAIA